MNSGPTVESEHSGAHFELSRSIQSPRRSMHVGPQTRRLEIAGWSSRSAAHHATDAPPSKTLSFDGMRSCVKFHGSDAAYAAAGEDSNEDAPWRRTIPLIHKPCGGESGDGL